VVDLIREVPLVKIATILRKDLEQIGHCHGLCLDDDGVFSQRKPGGDVRELRVIGWFLDDRREKRLLVLRLDDGRLLQQGLSFEASQTAAEQYPQLFVR